MLLYHAMKTDEFKTDIKDSFPLHYIVMGRLDFFWPGIKSYHKAFWFLQVIPIDFDVTKNRVIRTKFIVQLLPWMFLSFLVEGGISNSQSSCK